MRADRLLSVDAGQPRKPRGARTAPKRPAGGTANGGKRGGGNRHGLSALTPLLLIIVAALAAVGVWRAQEYKAFAEMKQVVNRQTFYQGTTVDGTDVSGMTLEEALNLWDTQIEPAYRQVAVTLNDGTRITAEQMGAQSNYSDVLTGAWSAGRSGSLEERYAMISERQAAPEAYSITRSAYDDATVRAYAAAVAAQVDTQARDAGVGSFDAASYAFTFSAEQVGYTLDQAALTADMESALAAGGGAVDMRIDTVAPAITLENIQSQYGMISSAITNASSSSNNRLSNIKLALSLINGTVLEPGESFSFNKVVGERTTARGFKMATAYSSGEVTEQVGGGICQVSTTLFNAAIKANMNIKERHAHSLTVSYVDLGKDAAVNWDSQDLRFTNTSDDKVYICCYLTDDKRVRFGIFGKLLQDGISISLEGVQTGTIDYTTQYQLNLTMASGATNELQTGKNGYTATTYKVTSDAAGNVLSREEIFTSRYQARNQIIEYGP